jgi:hypothetical protein
VRAAEYVKHHGAHIPREHLADDLRERWPKLSGAQVDQLLSLAVQSA